MHTIRKWIRFLFGFSRRETNGFLILLPLMVIAVFSRPFFGMFIPQDPPDFSREVAILDSLEAVIREKDKPPAPLPAQLFAFNPNRASAAELERLGIPPKQATRIVNYRNKGGRFRRKADLLKIYGLDSTMFTRLYPYIDLPATMTRSPVRDEAERKAKTRVHKEAKFDLNDADTATLKRIRGIGPVLAERIVRYRKRLGGFVERAQLLEVYRLDPVVVDALFQTAYIREDFVPRKISLNSSDEHELAAHPYVGKTVAKMIVAYRFQHGAFESLEGIRRIHHVDDSVFTRILPYVTID